MKNRNPAPYFRPSFLESVNNLFVSAVPSISATPRYGEWQMQHLCAVVRGVTPLNLMASHGMRSISNMEDRGRSRIQEMPGSLQDARQINKLRLFFSKIALLLPQGKYRTVTVSQCFITTFNMVRLCKFLTVSIVRFSWNLEPSPLVNKATCTSKQISHGANFS